MVEKKNERFAQDERVKLDSRIGKDVDELVELAATKLGTTKNSVVAVALATFCGNVARRIGAKTVTAAQAKAIVDEVVEEMFA